MEMNDPTSEPFSKDTSVTVDTPLDTRCVCGHMLIDHTVADGDCMLLDDAALLDGATKECPCASFTTARTAPSRPPTE